MAQTLEAKFWRKTHLVHFLLRFNGWRVQKVTKTISPNKYSYMCVHDTFFKLIFKTAQILLRTAIILFFGAGSRCNAWIPLHVITYWV